MSSKRISPKKEFHWTLGWSRAMFVMLYAFTAWATHGNYQATRAFVRIAPYFSALFLVVICVHVVRWIGKDYPVQRALAVAAIALFGASLLVKGWLALAGLAVLTVLVITSARAAIRKLFADLRESHRRIAATTRQL